jgi:hypothetical protein
MPRASAERLAALVDDVPFRHEAAVHPGTAEAD